MAALDEESAELVMEAHANRTDEAGIGRPIHEQPQGLRHKGIDLLGGEIAGVAVVEPRVIDRRVDDLALLLDQRGRNGARAIEQRSDLRKALGESGARGGGVHAAFSRRLNEAPSSSIARASFAAPLSMAGRIRASGPFAKAAASET